MRFSLLLLEENESYIEDHASTHFIGNEAHKGRLRVATKSLFFEPNQLTLPVLRFPFSKMVQVGELRERCVVVTSEVTEMRKGGKHYPYVVVSGKAQHSFSLDHRDSIESFLFIVAELFQCSRLEGKVAAKRVAEIVRKHRDAAKPFNLMNLVDLNEELLHQQMCCRIKPFIVQPCRLVVTTKRLYLQPVDDIDGSRFVIDLTLVEQVFRRRHSLRDTGVELMMKNNKSLFLAFSDVREREDCHSVISSHPVVALALNRDSLQTMVAKWSKGELSNFDYLMYLNSLADRSKNDLAQYPVFPWILCDYSSPKINLSDPKVYRDLSKPIGALNPQRLEVYKRRMQEMDQGDEKFLYGTHYSTPGYVLFYLVRKRPDLMLRLQNGKFDAPDRSFFSVAAAWSSCLNSHTDVKELIPEFFCDSSFLENSQLLDLGSRQNGRRVDDVELPTWAENDPKKFVQIMREALESKHVSQSLHLWIDLIFGCKQRDESCNNLFYPLTYQGGINVDAMKDEQQRAAFELQISEFGQTPKQVFFAPHPPRFSSAPLKSLPSFQVESLTNLIGSTAIVVNRHLDSDTDCASLTDLIGNTSIVVSRSATPVKHLEESTVGMDWNLDAIRAKPLQTTLRVHREIITALDANREGSVATVSKDGFVKVHIREDGGLKQTRASNLSSAPLACCQMIEADLVLVGSLDSKIYTYSTTFGKCVDSCLAHDDTVSALRFCNNKLVTGGWDTLVRLWTVKEGSISKVPEFEIQDLDSSVLCVDLTSNGVFVAVGKNGRILHGDFRVPDKVVRCIESELQGPVSAVKLVNGGNAVVCGNGILDLRDVDGELLPLRPEGVTALDASGDVVCMAAGAKIELWDCGGGNQKLSLFEDSKELSQNKETITGLKLTSSFFYAATEKGSLIWN